jgi:Ca-activated chloride channel family protein
MSDRATAKKIVDELETLAGPATERPEPPAGLREAILREVPETLELAPEVSGAGAGEGRRTVRWALAAAASVVVAVGAGVVAVRVLEERGASSKAPVAEEAVAALSAGGRAAEPAERERTTGEVEREVEQVPESVRALGYLGSATGEGGEDAEHAAPQSGGPAEGRPVGRQELREGLEQVFPAPGVSKEEETFSADGVVVTDMASVGASPTYYEFDQFQELQTDERGVEVQGDVSLMIAEPPPAKRVPIPGPSAMPPSTGGTHEPNDQPYGDVFFEPYPTNPFIDTEDDPLSTFALDVDTGSYTVVRRYLTDGNLPPPAAVRVEELVNAFDYGDPPPARGDFRLGAEGARSPFGPSGEAAESYRLVRFSVRARDVAAADRKPAVLTFVVDVSGSMGIENRLALVKRALGLLLSELRPDDRVGLVVYGSSGRVVLPHTGDLEAIRRAVDGLHTEGATNAEEGLVLAYDLARRSFREGAINRVILCSDGVANVGATGHGSILERIGEEARQGVELTTVGFGMGNYNDVLMEQLANRGDGAYAYVDTLDEARRVFVENLTGTLQTVARDAKVQVELNPEVVSRYRLLGYENRDVPDERFRDDTVDAGEVGAGHSVTALYEVKLHSGVRPRAEAARLTLRYESAETGEVEELSRSIAAGELDRDWEDAPAALRLASVVAELAEVLKGSYWAKDGDLDALFRRAQAVSADYPGDLRVAELATLIGKAAALQAGR